MKKRISDELFPVVERIAKGEKIISYELKNDGKEMSEFFSNDRRIPYIEDVKNEVIHGKGDLEKVLIVCKSEPIAVKAAKFIMDNEGMLLAEKSLEDEQKEFDVYGIYHDEEDFVFEYSAGGKELSLFRISNGDIPKEIPVNIYLNVLGEVDADCLLYEGLENGMDNVADKVDAILADQRERKYIWITPEMEKQSWVTELRMKYDFSIVHIQDVSKAYYEEVFEKLIEQTEYELADTLSVGDVLNRIMKTCGMSFAEEDIDWFIQYAIHKHEQQSSRERILNVDDFCMTGKVEKSALERLTQMPGLKSVKEMIVEQTALLKEMRRNEFIKEIHGSMVFYGNPGTGKTTCARLLAEIMSENGVSNAVFVEATRADIIGKYVGHTATKVEELFMKARGGILFVDEAGFFLNTNAGGYVQEAIKEFVRFMEVYPDVTVIFGMYEKEAEAFLKLDEGLTSRISRMVEFKDYSVTELSDIFQYMVSENGYTLDKGVLKKAMTYFEGIKRNKGFGNARDVRKLVESTMIAHSVRLFQAEGDKKMDVLTIQDITRGMERIQNNPKNKKDFGFRYATEGNTALKYQESY